MPFATLNTRPGINTQLTRVANPDGFSFGQLIRWFWGKVQKYGGWTRLTSTPLVGTCRGMHAWSDLSGNPYLACGTEQRLEVFSGGQISDITPIRATTNPAVNFSTVINTPTVTIVDNGHGANTGDWINVFVQVSVGGLIIYGFYIVTVIDTNTYTINAGTNATATVNNGGAVPQFSTNNGSPNVNVTLNNHGLVSGSNFPVPVSTTIAGLTISGNQSVTSVTNANVFVIVPGGNANATTSVFENAGNARIQYLLASGVAVNVPLVGYGTGGYGLGPYGIGAGGSLYRILRQWFLDNWGQLLIGNPSGGAIYVWTPPTIAPATVVATAPAFNTASFVIAQAQILVCLGAESGGTQFPNLVRWSDVSDYTDFIPTAANQAGSFQIPSGSKIIGGMAVGLGALIWTDIDLWTMTYQGLPFVFSFQKVSTNCEMISARSAGVIGSRVIWPSIRGFFQYDGASVSPLPCPVWDFFFQNVDLTQTEQIFCATNTLFNEMMWFFPLPSGQINYVKYNTLENVWDNGTLTRTAWIDHSTIGNPVGVDQAHLIQQHEVSNDADGQPMMSSVTSGLTPLGEGEEFWFTDALWPDMLTNGTTPVMQLTINAQDSLGGQLRTYGPFTFGNNTEFVPIRVRGRYIGYTIASNDLGSFWRIGSPRFRFRSDGRR